MIVAGFHVPVIPLVEVNGNAGAVLLWQILAIAANVGATSGVIVTSKLVVVAHGFPVGVKV